MVKIVSVPSFPGGKRIAVTFSFDDGPKSDKRVADAFNSWGMKATFNLNSGRLTAAKSGDGDEMGPLDAASVRSVFAGHEAAVHTVSHPSLNKITSDEIVAQVYDDRRALEDLVGYPVRGMAYPYGAYDTRVIEIVRTLGICYSRTTENSDTPFPPSEPLAWPATMHQYDASQGDVPARFNRLYDNPRSSNVFFVWGHTWEFGRRDDWQGIERLFKPLSGHSDCWYCTNIELFDYEAARRRMVIAANRQSAYNPSAIPVTVSVDDKLVEVGPGETKQF